MNPLDAVEDMFLVIGSRVFVRLGHFDDDMDFCSLVAEKGHEEHGSQRNGDSLDQRRIKG